MRKIYPMKKILNFFYDLESDDFKVVHSGTTIFTSSDVLHIMIDRWYDWSWCAPLRDKANFNNYSAFFLSQWQRYVARTLENVYRDYEALTMEYSPISNYDLTEFESKGVKRDKNTVETTPTGKVTQHTSTNLYGLGDNGTSKPSDDITTETYNAAGTKTTVESKPTNSTTVDFEGETHSGYNEGEERFFHKSGNAGVTTTQSIIQEELELRKTDLLIDYVKQFIYYNCFYTGDDDNDTEFI